MRKFPILIAFDLFTLISKNANAQAGTLDTTFNNDGIVTTEFGSNIEGGYAIALQSDGKIVVAGESSISGTNSQFILARYLSDGVLDTTFGVAGKVFTNFGPGYDGAFAVTIQTDGKIVAAGYASAGGTDFALARYNIDGSLDTTFNATGRVTTNLGAAQEGVFSIVLQANGKIVAVGHNGFNFGLARYNTNGSIDSTFDYDGLVSTNFNSLGDGAYAAIIQPDQKIVAGGFADDPVSAENFALARYDSTGALDTTFNGNGKVSIDIDENKSEKGFAMAIQPDGTILLAGNIINTTSQDFAIIRVNTNGSLDSSFGSNGIAIYDYFNIDDYCSAIALQPDGKILLAGDLFNASLSIEKTEIKRLNNSGLPDNTFGVSGMVVNNFGNVHNGANGMVLQNDGKILVAGSAEFTTGNTDLAIFRYNNDLQAGILDFSISDSPLLVYPNPVKDVATIQYTLNENENVTISLLDMNGRTVQTFFKDQSQQKGTLEEALHFSRVVSPGTYIISIANSQGVKGAAVKIMLE